MLAVLHTNITKKLKTAKLGLKQKVNKSRSEAKERASGSSFKRRKIRTYLAHRSKSIDIQVKKF